jgi:hypothetical protein
VNLGGNRFDRSELVGAFGDLGTLVPFVVGYISVARLEPQGVLLGFGLLAVLSEKRDRRDRVAFFKRSRLFGQSR